MDIGKIILKILNEKNMSVKALSYLTNIPYSTLSDIIKGKTNKVYIEYILKISEALEKPLELFIYEEDKPIVDNNVYLSEEEKHIIKLYRKLDKRGAETVKTCLESQAEILEDNL